MWEDNDESEDENDEENDDDKKYDKDVINITDLEPSLKKVQEAMNKVNLLLQKQTSQLKCDLCEFEARNANGLNMHKTAKCMITASSLAMILTFFAIT